MPEREAVVVDACRSPVGRAGERGVFRDIGPVEILTPVLKAIVDRNNINPEILDELILGSGGLLADFHRQFCWHAGWPVKVSGSFCSKQCASSSQAIATAAAFIQSDYADAIIASGLELTDRAGALPYGATSTVDFTKPPEGFEWSDDGEGAILNPHWTELQPEWIYNMGLTAEELSIRYNINREDSDRFALESQERYSKALEAGKFKEQIVPITIRYKKGETIIIDKDQCPRKGSTLEKMATLPPAFKKEGRVTAGNACPLNDGGGAVLLMSKEKAKELNIKPLATVRQSVSIGVDPQIMGIGPLPASEKLLKRVGMKVSEIDLWEINEAFACQVLATMRGLGLDHNKVNVNGGAIPIGHPFGMTGTRLTGQLLWEMNRRNCRFGITTLCVGGGQGMATLFEVEEYSWGERRIKNREQ